MKKIFFLSAIFFFFISVQAQNLRIKFEHVSLEKGLSQTSVRSIVQDEKGFIWFATLDGLNMYNGYEMKIYYNTGKAGAISDNVINELYVTSDEENPVLWIGTADHGLSKYDRNNDSFMNIENEPENKNSLNNNTITAIAGNNQILWVGTKKGLNKFEQTKNKWTVFTENNSEISNNNVSAIIKDQKENLWIATENGLNFFDVDLNKFNTFYTKDGLCSNFITCLEIDIYNNIWIGTNTGLCYYDIEEKIITTYTINNGLSDNNITSIKADHEGIIWVGTKLGGLNRFDPVNSSFTVVKYDATDRHSLSTNSILSIYQDNSNILWIGTSLGGVNKWNRAAEDLFLFRHNPYNEKSLSSSFVRTIFQDKDDVIWIGTVDGGLNKWFVNENRFVNYQHKANDPSTISQNHIRVVFEDSKGNFWLGTANNGLDLFNKKTGKVIKHFENIPNDNKSLSCNNIWRIIEDNAGNLWLATMGGGLNYFDNENYTFKAYRHDENNNTTISSDFVTTVFEDSKGRIWVGTNKGFNRFFLETGEFKSYLYIKNRNSITNNRVYSITEDKKGDIWIGTKGGLNKFNPEKAFFTNYTTQSHDLINNVFMGILIDKDGSVWGTTNRGLAKLNPKTDEVRTYDTRDGLQSHEFLVGSFLETKDGKFIIGGVNGFNAFYPEKIKDNPNIPSIVITGFQISNHDTKLDTAISEKKIIYLNHTQTDISFQFVALDYIYPSKNQYAYMLEGYDKDWVYSKYQRFAKYTNLKPGKYVFKVKGSNNDALWNEKGVEVQLIIKPAFWQTLWFKIGSVLFVILLVLTIVWWRIHTLHKQKRILKEEVERQTKEITNKNAVLTQQKEEILTQNEILQQAKEEIETQRDEIQEQRDVATEQRDKITSQKKDIEDSIKYAKRIQTAALPEKAFINDLLPHHFILFRPRDIVSGDFYWFGKKGNKIIAIAADCTGHGVPGAFMSMLGISFLNKIISEKSIIKSNEILERLRKNVIVALHQTSSSFESRDGMDISLSVIDYDTNILYYSGANNPLYFIRNKEFTEYSPDKMPIAMYDYMKPFSFEEIKFQKDDIIYMFSDGYPDQFGGKRGKKFMYGKFKKLLIKISDMPMKEQKEFLENTIDKWQSYPDKRIKSDSFSQIDDIVVIGIKL